MDNFRCSLETSKTGMSCMGPYITCNLIHGAYAYLAKQQNMGPARMSTRSMWATLTPSVYPCPMSMCPYVLEALVCLRLLAEVMASPPNRSAYKALFLSIPGVLRREEEDGRMYLARRQRLNKALLSH